MKKDLLWAIISILIVTKILIVAQVYFQEEQIFNSPSEECKIINYTSEGRVNIVFISDKNSAEEYSNYLLSISPFNEKKEQLNFFYIDTYNPECELYKGIAILCKNKEIIKIASSCPNDYIVVLKDEERSIRSSSYMNILSINKAQSTSVFAHEFGHAFAKLADEYYPANLPKGQENCKESCDNFEGFGCFKGCSKENYYRSYENGLMKTLTSNTYGEFNSKLISKELIANQNLKITGNTIKNTIYCPVQKYYLIEGNYIEGKVKIKNQSIQTGCPGNNGKGYFEYRITQKDGIILSNNFNPEIIFTDNEEGGEAYNYEGDFYLKIPLIEKSKKLEIILDKKILTEINLLEEDSLPCEIIKE